MQTEEWKMANQDNNKPQRDSERCVFLFGSLSLSFDALAFAQVRKAIANDERNSWLVNAARQLPQDLETILSGLHSLNNSNTRARKQLADLHNAIIGGRPLDTPFPLPNTVLIPLVVIEQLSQYADFARQKGDERSGTPDGWPAIEADTKSLGLCTGNLAAFAASIARSWGDFQKYGAAAVRLGLLVGLVIDSQDEAFDSRRWRSLSVAWIGSQGGEELQRILPEFDEVMLFPVEHVSVCSAYKTDTFPRHMCQYITTRAGAQSQHQFLHYRF